MTQEFQVPQPRSKYSVQEIENCLNSIIPPDAPINSEIVNALVIAIDQYAAETLFLPQTVQQLETYLNLNIFQQSPSYLNLNLFRQSPWEPSSTLPYSKDRGFRDKGSTKLLLTQITNSRSSKDPWVLLGRWRSKGYWPIPPPEPTSAGSRLSSPHSKTSRILPKTFPLYYRNNNEPI